MNDKIKDFLEHVGFDTPGEGAAGLHLLRYFEEEYGVALMGLMEKEWLDEQVENDFADLDFHGLRTYIADEERPAFDRDVETLFGE